MGHVRTGRSRGGSAVYPLLVVLVGVLLTTGFLGVLVYTAAEAPGEFTIADVEPGNTTVNENETVTVSVTVENTGDAEATQIVDLSVGDRAESASITLGPGERETLELAGIEARALGLGSTAYSASTEDDEVDRALVVESERPPAFEITAFEPGDLTAANDERINVSAVVENTGGNTDNQTVTLRLEGEVVAEEPMELPPNEADSLTVYNLGLGDLEPGERSYTVSTGNDSVTGTITVPEPAAITVGDLEPGDTTVDVDEEFDVSVALENLGALTGTPTVELRVGEDVLASQRVVLDGGEETDVVFEDVAAAEVGVGAYDYTVSAGGASESGRLVVEGDQPASYEVTELDPEEVTVEEEGLFDLTATIENTGEQTGEESVRLLIDGSERVSETVELQPGEREAFRVYNVYVGAYDPGVHEFEVVTDADSASGTLVIED